MILCMFPILFLCFYSRDIDQTNANMSDNYSNEYVNKIFNTGYVHKINLVCKKDDVGQMLNNGEKEKYILCDADIDGEIISGVGLKTRGRGTHDVIPSFGSQKYSLKIKFNEYVSGQTYYGLDSLALNNQLFDKTFLSDYFSYDMMRFVGVPAPYVSFSEVYINDEYFGFFTSVELISESFLKRNFGNNYGHAYKPVGGFTNTYSGCNLVYIDDKIESYSGILGESKTKASTKDKRRVIDAIKRLNGDDPESAIDVDEVIKYFAVNNFLLNYDSYWSPYPQNFFLYEKDGKLSILPWDYDFIYGGQIVHGRENYTKAKIDDLISRNSKIDIDQKPLWSVIINNEEYITRYHDVLLNLIDEYIDSGYFEREFLKLSTMIYKYIEKDFNKNSSIYLNLSHGTSYFGDIDMDTVEKRTDMLKDSFMSMAADVKEQILTGNTARDEDYWNRDVESIIYESCGRDVSEEGFFRSVF